MILYENNIFKVVAISWLPDTPHHRGLFSCNSACSRVLFLIQYTVKCPLRYRLWLCINVLQFSFLPFHCELMMFLLTNHFHFLFISAHLSGFLQSIRSPWTLMFDWPFDSQLCFWFNVFLFFFLSNSLLVFLVGGSDLSGC